MKIPSAAFMELDPKDLIQVAKFQLTFLQLVAQSFWEQIVRCFPGLSCRLAQLAANTALWTRVQHVLEGQQDEKSNTADLQSSSNTSSAAAAEEVLLED